jgi:hypothetical protein
MKNKIVKIAIIILIFALLIGYIIDNQINSQSNNYNNSVYIGQGQSYFEANQIGLIYINPLNQFLKSGDQIKIILKPQAETMILNPFFLSNNGSIPLTLWVNVSGLYQNLTIYFSSSVFIFKNNTITNISGNPGIINKQNKFIILPSQKLYFAFKILLNNISNEEITLLINYNGQN